jgi:hypothetical protein
VEVAPEILAKYAGAYAGTLPNALPIRFEIYPSGGQLLFSRNGSAKQPLTPVSNTKFMARGVQLEFLEENREIVAIQFLGAAGEARLPRVREGR